MTNKEESTAVFDKLPPYYIKENFFGPALINQLLEYTVENQTHFEASTMGPGDGVLNPKYRVSSILRDFGSLKQEIKSRFKTVFQEAIESLRMHPFQLYGTEREIVAHANGAFYNRHIDTATSSSEVSVRVLTAVYYFHAQPKKFQGGDLRLLPLRSSADETNYLDIEPINDRLLLFPSWVPHQVMPVVSESVDFKDSRFAINCWYHKLRA
jgi:SM-20-related protein